ncbi:MAG: O-antigen ligase family protein [Bacteroidetes bacterium]|nr:O-antigen ligase family protein [Bacteroidota bacterium]
MDDIKAYILSILLSGILVNVISFLFLLSGRLVENRLGGTFDDTNYFGRFEVILIVISLAYLIYGRLTLKYKLINIALILISANLLRLSSSRAAILALGFVIILMSLFSRNKVLKYTLIAGSISVVAIFLAYAAAVKGALGAGFLTSFLDMSNATRLALNVGAFNIFIDYPLFGIGYHNFYNVYINHGYVPLDIPVVTTISVVHSWLFSVLAEQGLMGILSLFWLLYLMFRDLVRNINNSTDGVMKFAGIALFGMNFSFYFFGLFSPVFFPELQFGMLCGLTGAYLKIYELGKNK